VRVRSSAVESCQPGLEARFDRLARRGAIKPTETKLNDTQATPHVIEPTHGFAQSLQAAQSPESGAAERVAWEVPAKDCIALTLTPPPSPTTSRATRISFVMRPTNIGKPLL
jgi:hypothetical protein